MCDPATIAILVSSVAGAASSLFSAGPAAPPPVEAPAAPAPTARTNGAVVRLGIGSDNNTTDANTTNDPGFQEKRATVPSLGNLGRSGLAI